MLRCVLYFYNLEQGSYSVAWVSLLCSVAAAPAPTPSSGVAGITFLGQQASPQHCITSLALLPRILERTWTLFVCILALNTRIRAVFLHLYVSDIVPHCLFTQAIELFISKMQQRRRKYLTFVCPILRSASCQLNHEERNRDTDVQLLL